MLMFHGIIKGLMKKQKRTVKMGRLLQSLLVGVVLVVAFAGVVHPKVKADQFDQQIKELQSQNNQSQQKIDALRVEAGSLEATINGLNQQIAGLQAEIQTNENKKADLERQIAEAEAELVKQRRVLGQNIKAMYLEGQITTLEMLASSKDLSEFVDKEQYRNSVKDKVKHTLERVADLKNQLRTQKNQVEVLIKEKQGLQDQIATQKAEQDRLLGLNQADQAATDQQIKDNFKRITDLKRQQAIENMRLFGGSGGTIGGGGYPWGSAACIHTGAVDGACWNYDWAVNGSIWNWATGGYGYRNCTDWVAFRVRSTGRLVPSGLGNANSWDDRAPSYGYAVSSLPKEGAAAVSNSGSYGHVMYVEAVNGDGSIIVSDYNRAGTGKYDMTTLSAGTASNLVYVYF